MMNISKLIESGQVYFKNIKNRKELYEFLADDLYEKGYIESTFLEALKEREAVFPTGIVSNCYNIALPHVDSKHVKKNALILIILNQPIEFNRMDKLDEIIKVKVVFMLLIKEVKYHMQAISNLTKIWYDNQLMQDILKIQNKEELLALVQDKNI